MTRRGESSGHYLKKGKVSSSFKFTLSPPTRNPFLFLEVTSWMVLPHVEEAGGSKEPRAFPVEQSVCEDSSSDWLGLCPASATHQLSEPR